MIETFKDLKHGKPTGHEKLTLERTASQILHHMEDKDSEDSLESTRARVLCESFLLGIPSLQTPCVDSEFCSERPSDLRSEPSSRRDKLRPDFLKKNWSRHCRAQSEQ
jgi:hypothetical protein